MAFNSEGTTAYVANSSSNTVSVIDTATGTVTATVANDGSNTVSVINLGNNTVTATLPR